MVRITSSGEIVPDDDPRVPQTAVPRPPEVHRINNQNLNPQYQGPSTSIFDSLNDRLRNLGIPRWNIGPYTVEPIVSVGFVASLLVFGLRGLLFSGLLFGIAKWGSGNTGPRRPDNRPGHYAPGQSGQPRPDVQRPSVPTRSNDRNNWPQGGGYRLGRS